MTIDITIDADQEAFLVDAPTPSASPHRWIQAKRIDHEAPPSAKDTGPDPGHARNIMRAIVTTPPKTPTSSATSKDSQSKSSPQQGWR